MNADEEGWKKITAEILASAFAVSNEQGVGFLEKVYENAMFAEMTMRGLKVKQQSPLVVRYRGSVVGEYIADLIVADSILIELKHVRELDPVHSAQCLNYLRATGLKLCLLINFGKERIEWRRIANNL